MDEKKSNSDMGLDKETIYEIKGKKFIVQPVFKEGGTETLGTILLRLIVENQE